MVKLERFLSLLTNFCFMSHDMGIAIIMIAASFGPGFAIALIGWAGLTAIGRNPEAGSKIQGPMMLALAFAEAIAIYALVVALVIKFA